MRPKYYVLKIKPKFRKNEKHVEAFETLPEAERWAKEQLEKGAIKDYVICKL